MPGEAAGTPLAVAYHREAAGTWALLALRRDAVRVNGEVIVEHTLGPFDQVTLAGGSYLFHQAEAALRPDVADQGPDLVVRGVGFRIGPHEILNKLSCHIPAGRLTAVVGQSGCGKSTLLRVLSGAALPSEGGVIVDGKLSPPGDYVRWARDNLALVPQADIVHPELTIRQCLTCSALLRLGPLVSPGEKSARIDKLLSELELAGHADKRIADLSGGQRKRVNVAVELIRSPRLVLLDEPTSGLDYHTERGLVALLRRMSRQGRTVVFVTHSLESLPAADHAVFLANDGEGGRVVAEGPPQVVLDRLRPAPADGLADRSAAAPPAQERPAAPLGWLTGRAPRLAALTSRYVWQWLSSPLPALASLLLLPLVLGLLIRLAAASDGRLGSDRMLFGLVAAFWLGMNQSVREIVRERDIFLREHAVRIGALPVLCSKLLFFAAVALPQAVLLSAPLKWLEVEGWQIGYGLDELRCPWWLLIAIVWVSDLVGCVLGLLISAGCLFFRQKGEVVAVLLVILVTLPQILFSAKVVPGGLTRDAEHFFHFTMWHDTARIPELCSFFTVTRYLFLPLDAVTRGEGSLGRIFAFNLTVLAMFTAVTVVLTWLTMEAYVMWQKRFR